MEALDNMAKGCALATGTTVDIDHYGGVNIGEREVPRHWEETGFATLKVPGVHISTGTEGLPQVAGHSQENADITISPAGHKSLLLTTKVMGAVALRLLLDKELREKAEAEHTKWLEKYNE